MNSPKFDYFDYEPILEWAKAEVSYSNEFISGGIVTKNSRIWLL